MKLAPPPAQRNPGNQWDGDGAYIVPTAKSVFRTPEPRPETRMEKTAREVKERLDGEAQKREAKTMRLRAARLEREASAPAAVDAVKSKAVRKTPRVKSKP